MKINEIMINDWFNFLIDIEGGDTENDQLKAVYQPMQVDSVSTLGEVSSAFFGVTNDVTQLQPIPLIPEILERNGWGYNNEDEKFFPKTWVGGGLMLQDIGDCGYRIVVTSDYDDEDTNDTPFIILYVHELQHALKLRRIDKEITI